MTIGIIGFGFVGKAVSQLSEVSSVSVFDTNLPAFNTEQNKIDAFGSDFVFCCVPTNSGSNGNLDLRGVEDSARGFVQYGQRNGILVIKSTVTPGTTEMLTEKYNTDRILMSPEFLSQNTSLEDFRNPTDVVIGGNYDLALRLIELYDLFYKKDKDPNFYSVCSSREAELVKIVRNSFYAVKISFMNEIYRLCEKIDISYPELRKVLTKSGSHPWLNGQHTMVPGPDLQYGFGGKCLPKDSIDLATFARTNGIALNILETAIRVNNEIRVKTTSTKPAIAPIPVKRISTTIEDSPGLMTPSGFSCDKNLKLLDVRNLSS